MVEDKQLAPGDLTPDGYLVQGERRKGLLDAKCATKGCWHRRASGIVLCRCCYFGHCTSFTIEEISLCLSEEG